MTPSKDSSTISRLNEEWKIYAKKNRVTQIEVSKKLGWSDSFFGSILRGKSHLSSENLIKIINLLKISTASINASVHIPKLASMPIYRTSSGKPSPAEFKRFAMSDPMRVAIWIDEPVIIRASSGAKSTRNPAYRLSWTDEPEEGSVIGLFRKGHTLFCTRDDLPANPDPLFIPDDVPMWAILTNGEPLEVSIGRKKPKVLGSEVLRVVGVIDF